MKNVIVGSAIVCQDMLEFPRGEVDEGIGLIVGDVLVEINGP